MIYPDSTLGVCCVKLSAIPVISMAYHHPLLKSRSSSNAVWDG